jgi:hypothetical protein
VGESQPARQVFLGSVALGLEPYRDAAYKAIEGLDGYHCVRMEDFGARAERTTEFCIKKVQSCDVYVGIVGQRYGSCPSGSDLSYTEIEYNAALAAGIPTLMFMAPEEFPVPADLIESDEKRERLRAFRNRVQGSNPKAEFSSESHLAYEVAKAFHNERERLIKVHGRAGLPNTRTYLLFPFVVNIVGYDTGIAIANTGADPFGTAAKAGVCTFHYYGRMAAGATPPRPQTTSVILPGEVFTYVASTGSTEWGADGRAAGFSGYVIVECDFRCAYGYAYISAQGAGPTAPGASSSYLATVIKPDRSGE